MAELLREGCAFEDVWSPQLRDYSYAGKSWLSSTRAPKVGLDFGALPCCLFYYFQHVGSLCNSFSPQRANTPWAEEVKEVWGKET
jgi:hypothetical protein